MARRVFLHVGTMKSASTYLQALSQLNRDTLREAGIWWPGATQNFAAMRDFFGDAGREPADANTWLKMKDAIRSFDGDVLISNELLAKREPGRARRLAAALEPAETHVVITARDLGRVIPSMWQTSTRNRGTATWAEFLAAVYEPDRSRSKAARRFWSGHDVPDIVSRWSQAVPIENVTLVTVPPPGSDPTVIGDRFMSVVAPALGRLRQPSYRNASLGAHSAELMRRVNAETSDWDMTRYRPALKNKLARSILGARADIEPKLGLTEAQLRDAAEIATRMVRQLEDLKVRVVGDLADLIPASSLQPSEVDPDSSTDAEVLAAALYALAQMSGAYADLKLQQDGTSARTRPAGARSKLLSSAPAALEQVRRRLRRPRH